MSRLRYVKGNITEITGGTRKIFAKEGYEVHSNGEIINNAKEGKTHGEPGEAPKIKVESKDFDLTFVLDKEEDTIVPFGIKDFKDNEENQFLKFKLKVSGDGVNQWQLDIKNKDGVIYTCYSATQELDEVVIIGKGKKTSANSDEESSKSTTTPSLWPAGEYTILWDGFDEKGIYDSTLFNDTKLEAKITATKDGKQKSATVDFSTAYSQVQWTDVRIDKKAKRIDVTLRVNLTDGGTKGLSSWNNIKNDPPYTRYQSYDWDMVPASVLKSINKPVIKTRTKTYEEQRDLAIEGLAHYWGRNATRGKNVMLSGIAFEVFVNAVNLQDKAKTMDDIPLVYHTNGDWGRSGNPASPAFNALPDTGMVQQLSYSTGYIKRFESDHKGFTGWVYMTESSTIYNYGKNQYDAITDFKETAAHEIGHEILYAYYGNTFSWQHKGSSYYYPQDTKPTNADKTTWEKAREYIPLAPYIPIVKPLDFMPDSQGEYYPKAPNEIDLMKYYNIKYTTNPKINAIPDTRRTFATENDVLGLIWLTKIKLK